MGYHSLLKTLRRLTVVNQSSNFDSLSSCGLPWLTLVNHYTDIVFYAMKKHGRPSKTMVTMVDHGHCFAWDAHPDQTASASQRIFHFDITVSAICK